MHTAGQQGFVISLGPFLGISDSNYISHWYHEHWERQVAAGTAGSGNISRF